MLPSTASSPAGGRDTRSPVGQPIERLEDLRLLRGAGCFVDDLHLPSTLHAVLLRSPVAHGVIRTLETGAAAGLPGVAAVITAADVARACAGAVPRIPMRQEPRPELEPFVQPVIAHGKVRFVGEPLALVVAESAALAEDALEAIRVEIAPLPAVASAQGGDAQAAPLFEDAPANRALVLGASVGDCARALSAAPYRRVERLRVQRHTAVPMEPRGLVAAWDAASGRLVVYGAAKVPFHNRRVLAQQLGLAVDAIEMIETDVGGGFGVRGEFYPEDFLVPFAARRLGRPVKWIEDRREHLAATNHAREVDCEIEIGCARDGTVLALRARARVDVGAYLRTTGITPARNLAQISGGPYRIPDLDYRVEVQLTNKTPVGTYRAPGRFEADFFRERMFDIAADDLGIDRIAFRRRNLVTEAEIPYRLPIVQPYDIRTATDSGNYAATLDRCLAEFGWPGKSRLDGREVDGRWHGLAVGCYIEGGASGPGESARLVLDVDGSVSVHVGSSSVGQGLETVIAQIAADALGMPLAAISAVRHGSTDTVRDGYGSYSARSTVMGGSAVHRTAKILLERVAAAAARRFGCAPSEVRFVEGRELAGPDGRAVTLSELLTEPISAEASFESHARTYSYGAHAAHVAVDPRTGAVELLDYVAVEDVGRIVNPLTLHGQTIGSIVQGLGGALLEELRYDAEGQLLTGTLADYLLPTATDFPRVRAFALEDYPSPNNPLGAKGAGEGGVIPVGGVIANAVASALRPFGVVPRELPLSPPKLWRLVAEARARAAGKQAPERLRWL